MRTKHSSSGQTQIPIIPDSRFEEIMDKKVIPYLASICACGYMEILPGGGSLYYEAYRPEDAKGAVVISHGYTESTEKYKEVIYYFVKAGYQVYLADHRGHGRSFRETDHPNMVHVNRFTDYVKDLHAFVTGIVQPSCGSLPLYLYAHSMGGCIGAFYLEIYPHTFQKAILTAPMLGISVGIPPLMGRILGRIMMRLHRENTYAPGQHAFVPGENFKNSCSACPHRYHYYQVKKEKTPLFQNSGSSYGWAYQSLNACNFIRQKKNCRRIAVPVLVFQSTNDSTVKGSAIRHFVGNAPTARLVRVPGSKHEIYNSPARVLKGYYGRIFRFLGEDAPENA